MTEQRKPILCLDFDGVIHLYESPWTKADEIHDGPVPGALEFMLEAAHHFELHMYSSRSNQPWAVEAMQKWLYEAYSDAGYNGEQCKDVFVYETIQWPTEKPPAFVTIDDRALTFTGTFPSIEELKAFKPWNKGRDNTRLLSPSEAHAYRLGLQRGRASVDGRLLSDWLVDMHDRNLESARRAELPVNTRHEAQTRAKAFSEVLSYMGVEHGPDVEE